MALNFLNQEIVIFAVLFLIFTALFRFALIKRFMKQDKGTASIIAICLSLLASYGLMRTPLPEKIFSALRISPDFLVNILPWLIIIILIAIAIKWGIGVLILILGGISFIAGITGLAYATTFLVIIGIILAIAGIFLIKWKERKRK
jgi:hypothetical protein